MPFVSKSSIPRESPACRVVFHAGSAQVATLKDLRRSCPLFSLQVCILTVLRTLEQRLRAGALTLCFAFPCVPRWLVLAPSSLVDLMLLEFPC